MAKLASKVYGDALFQVAVEQQMTDQLAQDAGEIRKLVLSEKELDHVMEYPGISRHEKTELIKKILDGQVSKEMLAFLQTVLEKDRYGEIDQMLDYFEKRVKEYKKIGVVFISTPMELNEEQKKQIEDKILQTSRYKSLECHYRIEPELIGGVVIRMNDRVIDSSLKTQMAQLSKNLLRLQIGKKV